MPRCAAGVSESALVGVALVGMALAGVALVGANAVFHATGKRIKPLRP